MSAVHLKKIIGSGYLEKKAFTFLMKKIKRAEHILLKMDYPQMNSACLHSFMHLVRGV